MASHRDRGQEPFVEVQAGLLLLVQLSVQLPAGLVAVADWLTAEFDLQSA